MNPAIFVPIVAEILSGQIKSKTGATSNRPALSEDDIATIARVVAERVIQNPVMANELNAEKPYQSRVAVGSVTAALGVLAPIALNVLGIDTDASRVTEVIGAAVTLWGAGFALWGRFKSGLKPLFGG